jgi:ferredoxin
MERTIPVDPSLVREVRRYGRFDVRGCLNCGGCTLTCDLSEGSATFPRRSMQHVLLGLREVVDESLEPWLCHDCGDCSTKCPEQVEPRESMATLRRYLSAQYDWTGLTARIHTSRAWAVGTFVAAGLLVVLLMVAYHSYVVGLPVADLATNYLGLAHMFPIITYFTLAVIFVPWFILISRTTRMYRMTMSRWRGPAIAPSLYFSELKTLLLHVATQRRIGKCPESIHRIRLIKHWLLAGGGLLMFVLLIFFLRFFQTDEIYPIYHPQRWLGYVATALLLFGSVDILVGRIRKKQEMHRFSELEDYSLPVLLFLTTVSGIVVHILRYLGLPFAAHYMYFLHLVIAVPLLVVEIPFGKSSHMLYRPLAIYFQSVRDRALRGEHDDRVEAA